MGGRRIGVVGPRRIAVDGLVRLSRELVPGAEVMDATGQLSASTDRPAFDVVVLDTGAGYRSATVYADAIRTRFVTDLLLLLGEPSEWLLELGASADAVIVVDATGTADFRRILTGQPPPPRPPSPPKRRTATDPLTALSARERDVLVAVGDGRSDREIGQMLGLRDVTVRSHIRNATRKLGCDNREEAAAMVHLGSVPPYEQPRVEVPRPLNLVLLGRNRLRAQCLYEVVVDTVPMARVEVVEHLRNAASRLASVDQDAIVLVNDDLLDWQTAGEVGLPGTTWALVASTAAHDTVASALEAGYGGVLSLDMEPADFSAGLRALTAGDIYVPPSALKRVIAALGIRRTVEDRAVAAFFRLSLREFDVVEALVDGHDDHATAATLCISPHTVQGHVANALRKFGVRDRAELVDVVERHHLIERFRAYRL